MDVSRPMRLNSETRFKVVTSMSPMTVSTSGDVAKALMLVKLSRADQTELTVGSDGAEREPFRRQRSLMKKESTLISLGITDGE